ncbi:hypothetical protein M1P56_17830 [Streptomyces sp. HU2014]|uniref:hypothetical protein n=1 Tax=Streptomyces sp. HU2014 TaxID=2939414 RepID=UPI00200C94C5|nr:hypothetical protein [Streptomyces sp. HU2014]UQI45975.1 hypothetical protein M1P56_17270 [Streptomyces sp. HU2014]UQI46073.1 hypothetical protein M1P56_17830 [Streptomyces sp. HU2014]
MLGDLLARYGHALAAHPLTRAWAAGACVMVNPFTSHLAHKKSVLALLTDPAAGGLLPPSEAAAARDLVPWTRLVRAGPTTCPEGRRTGLLDLARARRAHLVLKPNDDYGGKGVLCGWETTDQAWHSALGRALLTPHVLQERVPLPTAPYPAPYPDLAGGRLRVREYAESTDPFLFGTDSPGCICRLSRTSLLNVSTGAAPVPVFLITPGS